MPCCSSCSLPVQDHQLPTGARCSILFDKALHGSGLELECTVCLQPWGSHSWGKNIPKDCKFHWQQASGDTATDDLDPAEDGDVHSRLVPITQENQVIKVQLSQLTELVQQLLPQPGKPHSNQQMQVTGPMVPPQQRNRQQAPLGEMLVFSHLLGHTLVIHNLGFHWGVTNHCYSALQGNPRHHSMAILCQQYQLDWHCLTGRHLL